MWVHFNTYKINIQCNWLGLSFYYYVFLPALKSGFCYKIWVQEKCTKKFIMSFSENTDRANTKTKLTDKEQILCMYIWIVSKVSIMHLFLSWILPVI